MIIHFSQLYMFTQQITLTVVFLVDGAPVRAPKSSQDNFDVGCGLPRLSC